MESVVRNHKMANMGFVCSLLVVVLHVPWPAATSLFARVVQGIVVDGIAKCAVPFFFCASGYFLAKHFGEINWWKREVGKRVSSVLLPFAIWQVIGFLLISPASILADCVANRPWGASIPLSGGRWFVSMGFDFSRLPILFPLWYLRCLFFLVITSPLILYLVNRLKLAWLGISFAMLLFYTSSGKIGFWDYGYSLSGLFFFSCGVYLHGFAVRSVRPRMYILVALVGLGLIAWSVMLPSGCVAARNVVVMAAVPFVLVPLYALMPSKAWPGLLIGSQFPIYVMHVIVIIWGRSAIKCLNLVDSLMASVVLLIVSVVLCIGMTWLLQMYCPRVCAFLFAGRSGSRQHMGREGR